MTKVKYLGRQKRKVYNSTERFGETFYKLIFQKFNCAEEAEEEKIGTYAFSNNIEPEKWKIIEEKKLVVGDILEIHTTQEVSNRFGREKEYFHLLDFKIDKLIKIEELKQKIFDSIDEISNLEEQTQQLEEFKKNIDNRINQVVNKKQKNE